VAAKESLNVGDRIYLPLSVDNDTPQTPPAKKESFQCSDEERKFVCSLVLYKVLKLYTIGLLFCFFIDVIYLYRLIDLNCVLMCQDPAIIVLNKPHGLAVQVSHLYFAFCCIVYHILGACEM